MKTVFVLLLAAAALAAGVPSAEAATPPAGATDLGGISVAQYCQTYYGSNYKDALLGAGPDDWRCVPIVHHAGTVEHPVNMTNACDLQYGKTSLYAANTGDPYSWQCYQSAGKYHPLVQAQHPSGPNHHRPY